MLAGTSIVVGVFLLIYFVLVVEPVSRLMFGRSWFTISPGPWWGSERRVGLWDRVFKIRCCHCGRRLTDRYEIQHGGGPYMMTVRKCSYREDGALDRCSEEEERLHDRIRNGERSESRLWHIQSIFP